MILEIIALGIVALLVSYFITAVLSNPIPWVKTPAGMTITIIVVFAIVLHTLLSIYGV